MQFRAPDISVDIGTRTTEKSVFDTMQMRPFDLQIIRTGSGAPPLQLRALSSGREREGQELTCSINLGPR
jgi:hypothetical protein